MLSRSSSWCSVPLIALLSGCQTSPMPCPETPPAAPPASFDVGAAPGTEPAIPMVLPVAGEWAGVQAVLTIDVTADGQLSVDGESVKNDEALIALARAVVTVDPTRPAVIRADARATHGRVIRVLDLLRQAGVRNYAFGVTPAPPSPGTAPVGMSLPTPAGKPSWGCPFPPEADAGKIDSATVVLRVTVDAAGKATSAELVSETPSGHGFGATAMKCALERSYAPARDPNGQAVPGVTPLIRVRFLR